MKNKYLRSIFTVRKLPHWTPKFLNVALGIRIMSKIETYRPAQPVKRAYSLRKVCLELLGVSILTAVAVNPAVAEEGTYAIGLWGDLPYNDVQALKGVPNLIADMNSQRLAFTVQDGDLKGGNSIDNSTTITTCADGLYTQALSYFNALQAPAAFTPGDNDWTDCDRP